MGFVPGWEPSTLNAWGKMHARGPVGLEQLTSFKYLVHGDGQTRP